MRHVVVRRAAVSFGAALLVCAAVFAWLVRGEAPVASQNGKGAFARYCATCHTAADVAAGTTLELLHDHGEAPESDDRAILDYLNELEDVKRRQ